MNPTMENRIGEQRQMSNGMYATIIAYRTARDIDVQFEDGTIVTNKNYRLFKEGNIGYYTHHLNEIRVMNNGMKAKVIAYRTHLDIDIEFEDGTVVKNRQYYLFKIGNIGYPQKSCLYETNIMKNGMNAKIIALRNKKDMDVQFEDGTIVTNKNYEDFKRGKIGYPKNRIQKIKQMSNGLYATIIEYRNACDMDIQFEDGTIVKNRRYGNFKRGDISHEHLKKKTPSIYQGFETVYAYVGDDNTKVYYKTKCLCCGKKALLTPQEMIEHRKYEPFEISPKREVNEQEIERE